MTVFRVFSDLRKRLLPGFYGLIALFGTCLALAGWSVRSAIPLLHNLEGQVVDAQLRWRGELEPAADPAIAILLVDDRSIGEFGSLPIDRRILAGVVDRLREAGAAWIVFDILFAEPTRRDPGADASLAAAVARTGNVVLPFALPSDGCGGAAAAVPDFLLDHAFSRYRFEERRSLIGLVPRGILPPLSLLGEAARAFAHVSVKPGADGTLRYDLPGLYFEGELFPSLALRAAALAKGVDWQSVEFRFGDSVQLGGQRIPLDVVSRQWVNYYGAAGTFPTHSIADLAAGRLDPALFRGRIVLIGGTVLGSSDRHPSAFDPAFPGVEWCATVIDNILTGRWLERPAWAAPAELAGMVLLPLIAMLAIARFRVSRALVLVLLGGLSVVAAAQGLFAVQRQFISLLFPFVALFTSSGLGLAYRALLDERSRRRAEARLRASEERYALAAAGANDGLWDWDIEGGHAYFSSRARQLMAIDEAVAAQSFDFWLERLGRIERAEFRREMDAHLAGLTQQFYHVTNLKCADEMRWLLVRGVAVRRNGKPVRMAGSLTNITEQKRLERQIAFDALHDRLTGLANRELFSDRIDQLLVRRGREDVPEVGIALVDIDAFREVNELHGQVAGNAVLADVAGRLGRLKDEGLMLARIVADQFAIGFAGPLDMAIARRIQACFESPFRIGDDQQRLTATVAVAHSSQGLSSADELVSAATLALVHAKHAGRGLVRCFDPGEQALEISRRWLDENIDRALAAGDQFKLYYQPFVRLSDRRLLGFEALIRWHHPERGLIMPGDFIPHAEQSTRIDGIGRWCLFEVARQLSEWEGIGFGGEIAVNLSGRQFSDTDLEADAQEVLKRLGSVESHRYKFEVTESMAMENPQRTTDVLKRLAGMGFKISIDDFGTGYSSLAYLNRFPFDTIKIDRSFVIRLGSGREAREIVRTICGLGTALAKQVLAEGVEEEAQAVTLQELGVQVGQGMLFGKGLPADEAVRLIRERRVFR